MYMSETNKMTNSMIVFKIRRRFQRGDILNDFWAGKKKIVGHFGVMVCKDLISPYSLRSLKFKNDVMSTSL